MRKKILGKKLRKILKKTRLYLYYISKYPQSVIKAALFFIILGPKDFLKKLKEREQILSKVPNINLPIFNFLFLFFSKKIFKGLKILFAKGPKALAEKIQEKIAQNYYQLSINQQYQIWLKKNYPTKKDLQNQKKESKKFKYKPLISIITPIYNPAKKDLIDCIESVVNQSYPNWQLCLVDDASTASYVKPILKEYAKKDKRITVKFRDKNGHICQTSNDALKLAKGEFIALLDHDDFLWPNALYEVVKLLNKKPSAQFTYSDEDKLDYDGKTHIDPFFKPDWSPDYLRSINYITHFAVLKKSLIKKIGGFRVGTEGAQDWDLFLRASWWLEKNIGHCHPLDKKNPIQHIPTILYSWRKTHQSTSSEKNVGKVKNYAYVNQIKIINDYLKLLNLHKYLTAVKSKNIGQIIIKIKNKKIIEKLIKQIDIYANKNEKLFFSLDLIIPVILFNKKNVILPLRVRKNNIFDIENNWLFYKNIPQPHPYLLKKDSNFNYVKLKKITYQKILKKEVPFISSRKITLSPLNINKYFLTSSPYFLWYEK